MKKIINYLKLMRIKHYIKNILIFVPIIFGRELFNIEKVVVCVLGCLAFSFVSSVIYIINDFNDIEKDRMHPEKKKRPLASGAVSKREGIVLASVLFCLCVVINVLMIYYVNDYKFILFEVIYFILNLGYSFGLKKVPILDVVILVSGFVIRVLFGGAITGIKVSNWLCLTVMSGSFYMGLGKRRNELIHNDYVRDVLNKYNKEFLDKFMNVFLVLSIVFYSLWCISSDTISAYSDVMIWTIPCILIIFMEYSLDLDNNSYGDPVEILVHDKNLIGLVLILGIIIMKVLYFLH